MSDIQKGVILTLEGKKDVNGNPTQAKVQSTSAEGTSTMPITIPWYLRGKMGNLAKGTEIAFAVFDDASGIILSRMDGNWDGTIDGDIKLKGSAQIDKDMSVKKDISVSGNIRLSGVII